MFLFVDGDSQDKERLLGALSAYMLLGMILNSRRRITAPSLVEKDGRLNACSGVLIALLVLCY